MKNLIVLILAGLTAFSAFAEDAAADKPRKRKSPIEIMRERRGFKARPNGGYVVKGYDKNIIAVRDGQTAYKPEEVEAALQELRKRMGLPVFRLATDAKHDKVGLEVELVDEVSYGKAKAIVAAPEESWAQMSVKRLVADGPDAEKRARRLRLEIFRATMLAAGVGYSFYQPCLMSQVRSLSDLDAIRMDRWSPYCEGSFDAVKARLGIDRVLVMTYRAACKQGWAPKPANEEQQKIWDEIMTIPDKPITIEKK